MLNVLAGLSLGRTYLLQDPRLVPVRSCAFGNILCVPCCCCCIASQLHAAATTSNKTLHAFKRPSHRIVLRLSTVSSIHPGTQCAYFACPSSATVGAVLCFAHLPFAPMLICSYAPNAPMLPTLQSC